MSLTLTKLFHKRVKTETAESPVESKPAKPDLTTSGSSGNPYSGLEPEEELNQREEQIRKADPDQSDLPYYIGERLEAITRFKPLLEATGCETEKDYMQQSMERLGFLKSTAYNYRKYYRTYRKYKKYIDMYGDDFHINKGYLAKMLLLDRAVTKKSKNQDSPDPTNEVIEHFINDSYREFRYYVYPELQREDIWKKKYQVWKKKIVGLRKHYSEIYFIYYKPSEQIDELSLLNLLISIGKEEL
jgi:hypothetical protein